ncbi:MAG: hypothetical protein RID91_17780 [Azospirillaceae bacterium]
MSRIVAAGLAGGLAAGLMVVSTAEAQTRIPDDAKPTCAVSQGELDGWFAGGSVARGGMVWPADSISFPPVQNTACDFYQWAQQMFLWLTSPEGDVPVFEGGQFYSVEPADDGKLQFVADDDGTALTLRTRKSDEIGSLGQAGGGDVLVSQAGSLTYYGLHANDVYAEYRTGQAEGAFDGTSIAQAFPTTAADLRLVEDFAGEAFVDGVALTMELKTSWVDAATVSDPSRYVTIDTTVPAFDRSSDTTWTSTGTEDMTLALVGMHVVGTVNGHPEMVWASFEHVDNAPDAPYYYIDTDGDNVLVPFDSSGGWLFMTSGGAYSDDVAPTAKYDGDSGNIVADSGDSIGPVDVIRLNPFGDAPSSADSAANNTDLVSLNSSVMTALAAVDDVRANYFQLGGIWSQLGQIPTSGTNDFLRGSLFLANATMETFHQYPDKNNGFQSNNCFTCHSTSSGESIDTSHIFTDIVPLHTQQ